MRVMRLDHLPVRECLKASGFPMPEYGCSAMSLSNLDIFARTFVFPAFCQSLKCSKALAVITILYI